GLTRIPKKQDFSQDFFNGRQLNNSNQPDEAVTYGAALLASNLAVDRSEKLQDSVLLIGCGDDRWSDEDAISPTCSDFQSSVLVQVHEGKRAMMSDNDYLDKIPVVSCTQIEASFNTDENGIPNVTAVDKSSGKQNGITTTKGKGLLSEKGLRQMLNGAGN
ncbi:Heat shock 70 kDa protein, partial [Taenia solium]